MADPPSHWLSRYSSTSHPWTLSTDLNSNNDNNGKTTTTTTQTFSRPLGVVESSFDIDGTHHGGRADMTCLLSLSATHTLSPADLRRRIALAWTQLRLEHVLLSSHVADDEQSGQRKFVVPIPATVDAAVKDAAGGVVWVGDLYDQVDEEEVYRHAQNVGRVVEPGVCLSKVFVLPVVSMTPESQSPAQSQPQPHDTPTPTPTPISLRFLIVLAHQISDGLSAYTCFSHFLRILNTAESQILASIATLIHPDQIRAKLPPAQEDLYPPIPGSKARQRWFWALTRVLRHVATPLPPTFPNPLFRSKRLSAAPALPEKFPGLFSYREEDRPPMACGSVTVSLSLHASQRLIALCRKAHVSIGAGCFALAALAMMEIYESLHPRVPDILRPAFAAAFPLNPRAFFAKPPEADSCMLAFSEGIVLPFLPSRLPVEGRFGVVVRHANRGLSVYQKRLKVRKSGVQEVDTSLDRHSPGRLLATGYVALIERVEGKLPAERRNVELLNPQGELRPRVGAYESTCAVSSIGSLAPFFRRGEYDLQGLRERGSDFAADFRDVKMGVRARENEFLIASWSSEGVFSFVVSYDANAISQEAAEMWAEKISGLLEKGDGSRL